MKHHSFCLLLLAAVLLAACSVREPQYRIGVSQCLDDAWRQKMNNEMERELLLHPDMSLTRRIAYGSNLLQCAQIDSFIAERVDLLIVSPNEAEAVKPAVSRAYCAGIPVIVADRHINGDEWTAFIGCDNYKVGKLMAEWVMRVYEETTAGRERTFRLLEVTGMPGSMAATLRHQGLMDGIGNTDRIQISSVPGYLDTYTEVQNYLASHPMIDAVVAQNDRMAIEASRALSETESQNSQLNTPIMGVDAIEEGLQAIVDGVITCSATYPSRGDLIVATAARILHGEPFVKDTVLETTLIDKTAAMALLFQHNERMHDLETLQIIQLQSENQWRQVRLDKAILVAGIVVFFLLFLMSLAYIIFKQRRMQTEIKREILPQLEDMQEVIQINRKDEAFIERLNHVIDEHLTDPNLTVENLGSLLQLSRTQVFRRVKAISGQGPLEYIRERRLLRADEMLQSTDMTIQQVAMEFCFNSPGYFSKCYKEYFGHLPSKRG